MKLSAARQSTGYVGRLQQSTLGWEVARQIPRNGSEDMPALVAIAPLLELPHARLEQVRAFLKGSEIALAVHGHKHEHAAFFDHIYAADGDDMHRTLVISGATFEVGRELDAAQLISLQGLPHTPEVTIEPILLPRSGLGSEPNPCSVPSCAITSGCTRSVYSASSPLRRLQSSTAPIHCCNWAGWFW